MGGVEQLGEIIRIVVERYPVDLPRIVGGDPFQALVAIILSQRTSRENVERAMRRFQERFASPWEVASANLKSIEDAIRPAGIWRIKARRIKRIAEELAGGSISLEEVLNMPYDEAKRLLSSLKGVGPKTADVFLMVMRREPVLPVDTHILRIMRRLGVADPRDDYESLRAKLESATRPEERIIAHLALIEFGREICRARNPRCGECPLASICPSRRP